MMADPYRHADWSAFRQQIMLLDNFRCVRCLRTATDGAILQVHHKHYVQGMLPWQYEFSQCETLCKGCHAEEHGHVMPQSGWVMVGTDDLGDISGECELCGTHFRHAFAILHPKWGSMVVGTDCCDKLTGTDEANRFMDQLTKRRDKLARFVQSKRWKARENGASALTQGGSTFLVVCCGPAMKIAVNGDVGHKEFGSVLEARKHLFEIMASGAVERFIARQRQKRLEAASQSKRRAHSAYGAFAP